MTPEAREKMWQWLLDYQFELNCWSSVKMSGDYVLDKPSRNVQNPHVKRSCGFVKYLIARCLYLPEMWTPLARQDDV